MSSKTLDDVSIQVLYFQHDAKIYGHLACVFETCQQLDILADLEGWRVGFDRIGNAVGRSDLEGGGFFGQQLAVRGFHANANIVDVRRDLGRFQGSS